MTTTTTDLDGLPSLLPWAPSSPTAPSAAHLDSIYSITSTAATLKQSGYLRVALQFPDALLPDAPFVAAALEHVLPGAEVCILGDTSYGECCVDEVAAAHVDAEVVVHYGNACLSPTRGMRVLYVFPRVGTGVVRDTVLAIVRQAVRDAGEGVRRLVVMYDVEMYPGLAECGVFEKQWIDDVANADSNGIEVDVAVPRVDDLEEIIEGLGDDAAAGDSDVNGRDESQTWFKIGPLRFETSDVVLENTVFLWLIGGGGECVENGLWSAALSNAALRLCTGSEETCAGFYAACARGEATGAANTKAATLVNASRILRKRFPVLEKAKDAERIGIVAGTLGVSGNLQIIERCKKIIQDAGKRWYVLLVGKPAPSKLANFAELDAFVLVACPQNAFLESKEYYQPVLTPIELEAALGDGDIFSQPYSADFRDMLGGAGEGGDTMLLQSSALTARGDWSMMVSGTGGAADFLAKREWQGLSAGHGGRENDTALDQLPTKAAVGQSGIASRYDGEPGAL